MDFDGAALDAVMLVGTTPDAHHADDPLASVDALRAFFAPRPWLAGRVRPSDLAPLRRLRVRLRAVFEAAAAGRPAEMVELLNDLLARHRLSPSISGHDTSDWHLHVAPGDGPLADDYAAGAAMGGPWRSSTSGPSASAAARPTGAPASSSTPREPVPALLLRSLRHPRERGRAAVPAAGRGLTAAPPGPGCANLTVCQIPTPPRWCSPPTPPTVPACAC